MEMPHKANHHHVLTNYPQVVPTQSNLNVQMEVPQHHQICREVHKEVHKVVCKAAKLVCKEVEVALTHLLLHAQMVVQRLALTLLHQQASHLLPAQTQYILHAPTEKPQRVQMELHLHHQLKEDKERVECQEEVWAAALPLHQMLILL